jgi:uncharacterized repeat protein (TIGR01451 family)
MFSNSGIEAFFHSTAQMLRRGTAPMVTVAGVLISVPAAYATIDNTATSSGSYGGETIQSAQATVTMEVEPVRVALSAVQGTTVDVTGGDNPEGLDAGDTVTFTVTVRNDGNVAIAGVAPSSAGVTANGEAGTASLGAFAPETADLAPGQAQDFTATYVLGVVDVYRAAGSEAGIAGTMSAAGTALGNPVTAEAAAVPVIVAAVPELAIAKDAVLAKAEGNTGAGAEPGDTITYTYTVSNTGNVAIEGVTITDVHEGVTLVSTEATGTETGPWGETAAASDILGVSSDASGPNGSWDVLGAGGAVTFTYVHTVTQAEFEAQ